MRRRLGRLPLVQSPLQVRLAEQGAAQGPVGKLLRHDMLHSDSGTKKGLVRCQLVVKAALLHLRN